MSTEIHIYQVITHNTIWVYKIKATNLMFRPYDTLLTSGCRNTLYLSILSSNKSLLLESRAQVNTAPTAQSWSSNILSTPGAEQKLENF